MQALVTLPEGQAGVRTVPIPTPDPGQILVRVKVIALNPTDPFYVIHPASPPSRTVGSDFSGIVDKLGEGTEGRWKVGDPVAGFLHGCMFLLCSQSEALSYNRTKACQSNVLPGAFAEYLVVDADLVFGIPPSISFEEAATMSLCLCTAANVTRYYFLWI